MEKEVKKVYHQHRDRQRAAILDAAKSLFIQKSIQGTTMGEIAAEARVTRATIYQYFTNLPDIAWAILEEIFESYKDGMWQSLEAEGTGFERLTAFLFFFRTNWIQNPGHLRFLAQFDVMYAGTQEVGRLLEITQRMFGGVTAPVIKVIHQGIEDGSLRPNLNSPLTASAIINMGVAMMVRLEVHRQSVEVEYGFTPEQIFEEACQLLLEGIRARN